MHEHLLEMTLIRDAGKMLETWFRVKLQALLQKLPENITQTYTAVLYHKALLRLHERQYVGFDLITLSII